MIFVLKDFKFSIEQNYAEAITRTSRGGTIEVPLLDSCSIQQGAQRLDRVRINATWHDVGSLERVQELRDLLDQTVNCRFAGKDFGQWVVAQIDVTSSYFDSNNQPRKIKLQLELIKNENNNSGRATLT